MGEVTSEPMSWEEFEQMLRLAMRERSWHLTTAEWKKRMQQLVEEASVRLDRADRCEREDLAMIAKLRARRDRWRARCEVQREMNRELRTALLRVADEKAAGPLADVRAFIAEQKAHHGDGGKVPGVDS